MRRWLVKTDPRLFSFADMVAAGTVAWVGVRHPLARRHLACFAPGDDVLVYHSGGRSRIVGIAGVVGPPYTDGAASGRLAVDLVATARLEPPVERRTLVALPELASWELASIPRLTVLPVPAAAWRALRRRTQVRNIRAASGRRR